MRGVLLSLVVIAVTLAAPRPASASASLLSGGTTMSAAASGELQNPAKDLSVDINVNHGGGRWYRSPVWIAIGAIAAVIVLLLIVLVARSGGGGTTIVRD
jgi:hypothetical protein